MLCLGSTNCATLLKHLRAVIPVWESLIDAWLLKHESDDRKRNRVSTPSIIPPRAPTNSHPTNRFDFNPQGRSHSGAYSVNVDPHELPSHAHHGRLNATSRTTRFPANNRYRGVPSIPYKKPQHGICDNTPYVSSAQESSVRHTKRRSPAQRHYDASSIKMSAANDAVKDNQSRRSAQAHTGWMHCDHATYENHAQSSQLVSLSESNLKSSMHSLSSLKRASASSTLRNESVAITVNEVARETVPASTGPQHSGVEKVTVLNQEPAPRSGTTDLHLISTCIDDRDAFSLSAHVADLSPSVSSRAPNRQSERSYLGILTDKVVVTPSLRLRYAASRMHVGMQ